MKLKKYDSAGNMEEADNGKFIKVEDMVALIKHYGHSDIPDGLYQAGSYELTQDLLEKLRREEND
jgi:hypothetical protein